MLRRLSFYKQQLSPIRNLYTMANLQIKGEYEPTPLAKVVYGRGSIDRLPELLESLNASKAFIVTGHSLQTKTPVIKEIEGILGSKHIKTFSKIAQHAPISAIREAVDDATQAGVDVFISVGGGSPIDSVKVIVNTLQKEHGGDFLPHIAIPTTLSVAETTKLAGYTNEQGNKVGIQHPKLCPRMIIYDGNLALHTPLRLWLSSGMRAVDHAMEMLYNPSASEAPHKLLSLSSIHEIFRLLPESQKDPENGDLRQKLQVAAFATLFSMLNFKVGLGLSHSMGHALGATYAIPHGITSCITLAPVVAHKARTNPAEANQIARLVPFLSLPDAGSDKENALAVAAKVSQLVEQLGLKSSLSDYKVPKTTEEMEAIAERATHSKSGDNFNAVLDIVKDLY